MTYSEKQQAAKDMWFQKQLRESVDKELQPLKEREQREIRAARDAETKRQVEANADRHLARIDKILGGDKALYEQVGKLIEADKALDPIDAAIQVRDKHLEAKTTSKVVDNFHKKAAGNTANGAGSSATPAKPRNEKELAKWLEARG